MMGHPYEIGEAAEKDWQRIVAYTLYNFVRRQVYKIQKVYLTAYTT